VLPPTLPLAGKMEGAFLPRCTRQVLAYPDEPKARS
jgi:hypothetical protein